MSDSMDINQCPFQAMIPMKVGRSCLVDGCWAVVGDNRAFAIALKEGLGIIPHPSIGVAEHGFADVFLGKTTAPPEPKAVLTLGDALVVSSKWIRYLWCDYGDLVFGLGGLGPGYGFVGSSIESTVFSAVFNAGIVAHCLIALARFGRSSDQVTFRVFGEVGQERLRVDVDGVGFFVVMSMKADPLDFPEFFDGAPAFHADMRRGAE